MFAIQSMKSKQSGTMSDSFYCYSALGDVLHMISIFQIMTRIRLFGYKHYFFILLQIFSKKG